MIIEPYRYLLHREWLGEYGQEYSPDAGREALFIMLNPSTADDLLDDPTITKCVRFAVRAGCVRLKVVNLYAWRATRPADLRNAGDPVGRDNDPVALAVAAGPIVAAWGAQSCGDPGLT